MNNAGWPQYARRDMTGGGRCVRRCVARLGALCF
jgi:hypothetical protein